MLEQKGFRLASSLSQLNLLILFYPFMEESYLENNEEIKSTVSVNQISSPPQTPPASTAIGSSTGTAWTPDGAASAQHQTSMTKPKKPILSPKYIDYN